MEEAEITIVKRKLEIANNALKNISDWNKDLEDKSLNRDVCLGMWRGCIKLAREALKEIEKTNF